MGCHCSGRQNYESVFKDFWGKIKLREITVKEYVESLKTNLKKGNITENRWMTITDKLLTNPELAETSTSLFINALKNVDKEKQYLLFLSLLFLCHKNSHDAKKYFTECIKIYFNKDFAPKVKEENDEIFLNKSRLMEIVSFYINLISLFSVKELSNLCAGNKKDFEMHLEKVFDQEIQRLYLEEELLQNYKEDELINLTNFFEKEYIDLTDDSKIRERLIDLAGQVEKKK
jgi:hypothetical protein